MQEAAARSLRRGLERLRPLVKNKTLRYGVPMMLLIIGGSFGLREFTQIRYDAQKLHSKMDPALEERIRKNKITLESEYELQFLYRVKWLPGSIPDVSTKVK
ncbi:cytochrome c oxidase assembly protein COX16 homolog, mitochondrial isoform X3 [Chrysemys picta bellii]|uniref:cytochrome c oxidase assembly protein COX16 homolog, mitochondrial isoform X3 n=1 Tax=Chrysemys picta bellii TaxID=8478 RepID=UPI000CE654EC|nr:cytochrome c oxidase assembly protein COX16 homolog, mitochondrial isoform X2 [Chrysemys picta bellii]